MFSVNFAKFLRTLVLIENLWWLLLVGSEYSSENYKLSDLNRNQDKEKRPTT